MRQVLSVSQTKSIPSWKQWKQLPNILSTAEHRTIQTAFGFFLLATAVLIGNYVLANRIEIPTLGGEYTEALIGEPQLINPIFASTNDADTDIASLIYSGLFKTSNEEGVVNDLASNVEINEEKTVYTITIRDDAYFHNGDEVLARDVLFTVSAIQNPAYRSPLAQDFHNVSTVQENDKTVSFVFEKARPNFLETLTVGVLPATIWAEILPQNAPLAALNLQPIGSGPYKFAEFAKDKKGGIRSYTLEQNPDYYGEKAKIERLTFKFYPDAFTAAEALENKNVEGASFIPFSSWETAEKNKNINLQRPFLPREIVLYFNEKTNKDLEKLRVRSAIAHAINKNDIVIETLKGNGRVIRAPILPGMTGFHPELVGQTFDTEKAIGLLAEAGFKAEEDKVKKEDTQQDTEATKPSKEKESPSQKKQDQEEDQQKQETEAPPEQMPEGIVMKLSLTIMESEEFVQVAERIKDDLRDVGITIEIIRVPSELFFSEVIEPRNFELLLTAVMMNTSGDPYSFWHSSEAEKGLNLAGYSSASADKLLDAGLTESIEDRDASYRQFQEIVVKDVPAVFLYQSVYTYALPRKIQGVVLENISYPSDRFSDVVHWYIKTKKALR